MADEKPPRPVSVSPPDPGDEGPSGLHPVLKSDMRKAFRINEAFTLVVSMLVGLAALWMGQYIFVSQARAAAKEVADSGIEQMKSEVQAAKLRLDQVEQAQKEVKSDLHEVQVDIRELYRSSRTGQKSERLEKPAPVKDGGP